MANGAGGPWAHVVLTVANTDHRWRDVAAFAQRAGTWSRLDREVRQGIACLHAGLVPPAATVSAAAADFRRERGLITAEETEGWLAAHALTVDDWMGHTRRTVLRELHAGDLAELVAAHPAGDEEVDPLLWPTGICGGHLGAFARALAERLAVQARATGARPPEDDLETALDRFQAEVVHERAIAEAVAERQVEWLRVDLDEAIFPLEGAAREAVLALREGTSVDEVCALAGAPRYRAAAYLEDLDASVRPLVVGARAGDVVGPILTDGGFRVVRVEGKVVASVDEPAIRLRAEELVLARALQREVEERVTWHERV